MISRLIGLLGAAFLPIALTAKLPFAMSVVAVMTSVTALTGSFGLAGATAALVGLGTAVFGPLLGAAADRIGQRPVLVVLAVANSAALFGLTWTLMAEAPSWAVLAAGFCVGMTAPQAASMVRARWLAAIAADVPAAEKPKSTSAVLSYESMTDELMFVFGPVFVGLFALLAGSLAPLIAAGALTAVGVLAFALHPSADRVRGSRRQPAGTARAHVAPARELLAATVLLPTFGMLSIGLFFGSTLTSLTGFMAERGAGDATGLVYGIMGVSSAVLALSVVALPDRFAFRDRWPLFALVAVAGAVGYWRADSLALVVVFLLIMGAGIGPSLVTLFSIASESAPAGWTTTVMTMLTTGVVVGQSGASALAGRIVDSSGYAAGTLLTLGAVLLLLLAGLVHRPVSAGAAAARRETVATDS